MTNDSPSPKRRLVRRAVGPQLKKLLMIVWGLLAVLGANSAYLAAISLLEWLSGHTLENYFFQWMFLGHVVLGLLLLVPFSLFIGFHFRNTITRRNRKAVNLGLGLLAVCVLIIVSGLLLLRVGPVVIVSPSTRLVVWVAHVALPGLAIWLYIMHRMMGKAIQWKVGGYYAMGVAGLVMVMALLHDWKPPQQQILTNADARERGPFYPSPAKTATGKTIPAHTLMNDAYCIKCHPKTHERWLGSAHRFSSFNNVAYRASIRDTRAKLMAREGSPDASRWCAGCHDPVPLFSGAFDREDFNDLTDPTASAAITCTVCHAMQSVDSVIGNADYTIDAPVHYPFSDSDSEMGQWLNEQLIKANPSFHKKTFLKPFHKTAEFCGVCHKVHLPKELNAYKEFLRGQNHYDSYLLSGVSGHGARSFYYPPKAQVNCNECHMPRMNSNEFGALASADGTLQIHDHLFPSANTGISWLEGLDDVVTDHQNFLKNLVRVDLFGLRETGRIEGELTAPLGPKGPTLSPGKTYLLETVVRTLKLGHHLTQGTADSNELWVELTVKSGDRILARSGHINDEKEVDPYSYFINAFVLDKEGNRIATRNAEDIFTVLYNHQIPPGAGASIHYELQVPEDVVEPLEVTARVLFRKFDANYMRFVAEAARKDGTPLRGDEDPSQPYRNPLPISVMAESSMTFPVAQQGQQAPVDAGDSEIPEWQRWNDYGIGLFLTGKAQLRQAEEAFKRVEALGRYDGPVNLARVYLREGRIDDALQAIARASEMTSPAAPTWTLAWLSGEVNRQQGNLREAAQSFRSIVNQRSAEMVERKFDFSRDYVILNLLGQTLFDLGKQQRGEGKKAQREELFEEAVATFQRTLVQDPENVTAHYNLSLLYRERGQEEKAESHRKLHERYRVDDNATDRAIRLAREKYPAANKAAEPLSIYALQEMTAE